MTEIERSEVQDALLKGLLAAEEMKAIKFGVAGQGDKWAKRCKEIEKALEIVRYL